MSNIKVITENPIAYESPDHIVPTGTKNDNYSNEAYVNEVETLFKNQKLHVMDIGCAGGQLAVDFHKRGHLAVGLEGSDYNIKHGLHNWPEYHNKVLFTADITKPFQVTNGEERVLFDLISAWEVVEHIGWNDLEKMFANVFANLKDDGLFIASINTGADVRVDENGKLHFLHQSVFPEQFWREHILNKYEVLEYPFKNRVRTMANYFCVAIKKPK